MLLMVEKGKRGGVCHSIYQYAKANNKGKRGGVCHSVYQYAKANNKDSSYLQIGM